MPPSADQLSNSRKLTNTAVWDTADKYLRNVVEPEEYGDYIIPFTVLRRIECLLADSKQGVLDMVDKLTDHGAKDINPILLENGVRARFGLPFYNTSKLDLSILAKTDDSVAEGLTQYLAGFSDNLRDIWEAFKFDDRIATLDKANRLYGIVSHFAALDLHPDSLSDTAMGDLFEDIMYRAFNTKGKGAGAFYTPRDAIELMVDLLFSSDDYGLTGKAPIRSIYDPAAGTGGMLLVARRVLSEMNPNAQISLAGQELMDYAYAMGKADLLIQGGAPDAIRHGDTLANDLYADRTFDYVLTNPPFGSDWAVSAKQVKAEAEIEGSRFSHGLPSKSDGQLLFLCHVASKLTPAGENGAGGRGAVVMNGSPLFTGAPGSGPDQIRRWLLTEDLVDAIIALPTNMFYGTGIATYIWIVDTNKPAERKGKIQLINGADQWHAMRKGMGDKRRELTEEDREVIAHEYAGFADTELSRVLTPDDLGFTDVPVYRQRRLVVNVTEDALAACAEHKAWTAAHDVVVRAVAEADYNDLPAALKVAAKRAGVKMPTGLIDAIMNAVGDDASEDQAETVAPSIDRKGNPVTVPGSDMTERVPLTEDVDEHMTREVLPFMPDAVWDMSKAKTGYEIPFTRIFYKPQPVRKLAEIDADLKQVMGELAVMLQEVER